MEKSFTIGSWNVNSINVRLNYILELFKSSDLDLLALQETKVNDSNFPSEIIRNAGYFSIFSGQNTYNGVAILSKKKLISLDVIDNSVLSSQKRIIISEFEDVLIINVYVPNGENLESDKFIYKINWLDEFIKFVELQIIKNKKIIILGDFNIAPDLRDIYDYKKFKNNIFFSDIEHKMLKRILDLGFFDSFRLFSSNKDEYTWWDYRQNNFAKNRGLRIDLILISKNLINKCESSYIKKSLRSLYRPSDHAPVIAKFFY